MAWEPDLKPYNMHLFLELPDWKKIFYALGYVTCLSFIYIK